MQIRRRRCTASDHVKNLVPQGRGIANFRQQVIGVRCRILRQNLEGKRLALRVEHGEAGFCGRGQLHVEGGQVGSRPAQRIQDHHRRAGRTVRFHLGRNRAQRLRRGFFCRPADDVEVTL